MAAACTVDAAGGASVRMRTAAGQDMTVARLGVENGRVQFDYHARHKELLENITPADVVWICRLFNRITDAQWADLYRGAAVPAEVGIRYTRKIKSKIQEGLALQSQGATR